MKEALIKTFEDERKQVERLFKERPYWMGSPYEVVHNALSADWALPSLSRPVPTLSLLKKSRCSTQT